MGRPQHHRWGLAGRGILGMAIVLLLTACGQDGTPAPGPTPTPTADATAEGTPTPTPAEVATNGPTPDGEATPTPSGESTPAGGTSTSTDDPAVPGGLRLTPAGFGPLELGMSEAAATDTGFIGSIGVGCELAGTRGAELTPPLAAGDAQGRVTFDGGSLTAVTLTEAAATEEGVAVGHSLGHLRAVYAGASVSVDRSLQDRFGVWLVEVTRADGGTYGMVVDPATERITQIAVPTVQLCE